MSEKNQSYKPKRFNIKQILELSDEVREVRTAKPKKINLTGLKPLALLNLYDRLQEDYASKKARETDYTNGPGAGESTESFMAEKKLVTRVKKEVLRRLKGIGSSKKNIITINPE